MHADHMLLKLFFLVVVLYYVVKTVRALVRAISQDGASSRLREDVGDPVGRQTNGSTRSNRYSDTYADVEDAKYVDI